jgi:hypothetical protein
MSIPNHEMVRRGLRRCVLVLLAGLGGLALPSPVARAGGLLVLYALGALAVLSGVANAAQALRVRETARWLLPASVFAVMLGLVALAAPASVGAALVRGLGAPSSWPAPSCCSRPCRESAPSSPCSVQAPGRAESVGADRVTRCPRRSTLQAA